MEFSNDNSTKTEHTGSLVGKSIRKSYKKYIFTPRQWVFIMLGCTALVVMIAIGLYLLNKAKADEKPGPTNPPNNNDRPGQIPVEKIDITLYTFIEDTVKGAAKHFKTNNSSNVATTDLPALKESFFLMYLFNSSIFELVYIDIYRCAISYISQDYFAENSSSKALDIFKSEELNKLWGNSELCRKWAYVFNKIANEKEMESQPSEHTKKLIFDDNEIDGRSLFGDNYNDYDTFDSLKSFFKFIYTINDSVFSSVLGSGIDETGNRGNMFEVENKNKNKINNADTFYNYVTKQIKENVLNMSSNAFLKFKGKYKPVIKNTKLFELFKVVENNIDLTPYNPDKAKVRHVLKWKYEVIYIEGILKKKRFLIFKKKEQFVMKKEGNDKELIDGNFINELTITSVGLKTWFQVKYADN